MLGSWKKERMLGRVRWGAAQLSLGGAGRASSGPKMCSRLIPEQNRRKYYWGLYIIYDEHCICLFWVWRVRSKSEINGAFVGIFDLFSHVEPCLILCYLNFGCPIQGLGCREGLSNFIYFLQLSVI